MVIELYIPKMSDHMKEAVFLEWLVDEGDWVQEGQALLAVETDKVNAEIDAPSSGYIKGMRSGLVEGEALAVGEVIAYIASDPDEDVPTLEPLRSDSSAITPAPGSAIAPPPVVATTAPPVAPSALTQADRESDGRSLGSVAATPAARRAAKELGVDLGSITGTRPGGSISEDDVRRASESS